MKITAFGVVGDVDVEVGKTWDLYPLGVSLVQTQEQAETLAKSFRESLDSKTKVTILELLFDLTDLLDLATAATYGNSSRPKPTVLDKWYR